MPRCLFVLFRRGLLSCLCFFCESASLRCFPAGSLLLSCSNSASWPSRLRCRVSPWRVCYNKDHGARAAGIPLTNEGLKQQRVGNLKSLLKDHGLSCKACTDRDDYIQFVLDRLASPDL